MKKLMTLFFTLTLFCVSIQSAWAQNDTDADALFGQSSNDLFVVSAYAGTGALLGLSTLSFMEDPWDHKKNILIGFSLGVIVGVGLVAFYHANRSEQFYDKNDPNAGVPTGWVPSKQFDTEDRVAWHYDNFAGHQSIAPTEQVPVWVGTF